MRLSRGISGAPAVGEDVLALSQTDRQVALLDRVTGEVLWRSRLSLPLGAGPLLAYDRLLVAEQTAEGRVRALRLVDGRVIWSARAGDVAAPLAIADSVVYAGTTAGDVLQILTSNGTRRWTTRLSGAVRAAPVPVGGGVVVATDADSLFLLDARSGAVLVRRASRGAILAALALEDSGLVVGTAAGWLAALDPTSLAERWSFEAGEPVVGAVAVRHGTVYAMTGPGTLVVVPPQGPGAARKLSIGLVTRAGPAPARGGVYVCGVTGEIVLVDSLGNRLWNTRLDGPVNEPMLADGSTLFAVSQRGEVVAFR
jgi:outer membrane protein assembly factor BamB